jgi:hypothetical protein
MRGAVGDVVEAGGADLTLTLLAETLAIAAASGHAPRREFAADMEPRYTERGSHLTSSVLRDLEHGKRVETDEILGDLAEARAGAASSLPPPHDVCPPQDMRGATGARTFDHPRSVLNNRPRAGHPSRPRHTAALLSRPGATDLAI